MTSATYSAVRPQAKVDFWFWIAIVVLAVVAVVSVLAPILPIPSYTSMGTQRLAPPSAMHWLGTDEFGRDLFARVTYAVRTSLVIAAIGVLVATIVGASLGIFAGLLGGAIDTIIMRFFDGLLAFPSLILAIGVTAVVGPGAFGVAIALGVVGAPTMARIARSATLAERNMQYIEGARSVGASMVNIVLRHLLPNVVTPILVQMALFFVHAVLTEAGLSFLGLGVQLPLPSLGSMLNDSRMFLGRAPWYALVPGVTLTVIVLCMNIAADYLAAKWDPRR